MYEQIAWEIYSADSQLLEVQATSSDFKCKKIVERRPVREPTS